MLGYLIERHCGEKPGPMVLGGTIMRDLELPRDDFFLVVGHLMEYNRIGVVVQGARRYYYHMGMVDAFRERFKRK